MTKQKNSKKTADGLTVETEERNGIIIETTRDAAGRVIDVIKRIKGKGQPGDDSRNALPAGNEVRGPI
ncbi:MAG: hypothetical protein KC410_19160 [Anaerolineales bacterium]|uniref:hypothetical protein n=1 Tax=Promineifilum sp. TaxID=2664178 RepID=UPI001D231AEB|nr:hypothetical protein [Anaerolineales bacterium]MCO5181125.1 hypothetical protein [Promineifilum sp.]